MAYDPAGRPPGIRKLTDATPWAFTVPSRLPASPAIVNRTWPIVPGAVPKCTRALRVTTCAVRLEKSDGWVSSVRLGTSEENSEVSPVPRLVAVAVSSQPAGTAPSAAVKLTTPAALVVTVLKPTKVFPSVAGPPVGLA